ncbi:MAG: ribonuclease III [Candidatus Berkelbacteria bacterium]|nr:ribonuclease III [Candidatus Berkelbacteria bacterium]
MTNPQEEKITSLMEKLNLEFKNPDLFRNAFVHRSYLNENKDFNLENNERLEFLGDAVLELVVTEHLYEKFKMPEGKLTALRSALVRGKNLSYIARKLRLLDHIYLSAGEKAGSDKAKDLILANCLEAVIGAIYLDLGYEQTKKFIENSLLPTLDKIIDEKLYLDAKSEFQEKVQEEMKVTPFYKVHQEQGPDHNKSFTSGVYVNDELVATGDGASKSESEERAARAALEKLFNNPA